MSTTQAGQSIDRRELIVVANLKAQRGPRGGLVLTQKFLNGVAEYARWWPGTVTTLVDLNDTPTSDMDHVEVLPGSLPFELAVRPDDEAELARRLGQAAVVLAFLSPREAPLALLCQRLGVPLVYLSEYSLKTEGEIIESQTRNPLKRWRRKLWAAGAEKQRLAALRLAAGIQCSGTPTFDVYRHVNANALLFFDSRVRAADVIDDAGIATKAAALTQVRPLRLVFGGRLIAMKGVQHLPRVARELVRLGVPFTLEIYGSGVLERQLAKDIERYGLEGKVELKGVLDFESGWVPLLKERVDLFVCCHPQGDPSSTYPEVMACGVPIVGYDNDAFNGIVKYSGAGWPTPLNQPEQLAAVIARLDQDRQRIASASATAREFAIAHCFERTFTARVEHLIAASRLPPEVKTGGVRAAQ